MSEQLQSTRKCGYCLTERSWTWTGDRLRDGSRIFVDEHQRRWAGKRCPTCERKRVQATIECPSFEKHNVTKALEDAGYEIRNQTPPLQAHRDGNIYPVVIRHATLNQGKVILAAPLPEDEDQVCVLVFQSIRVLPAKHLENLRLKEDKTSAMMGTPPVV